MMQNLTIGNRTIELNYASLISMVAILSIASVLNIFGLVIVFLSRSKLLKVEFFILVMLNLKTTAFKVLGVYQYSAMGFNIDLFYQCSTALLSMLSASILTSSFMTLLFYSVFQVSTVSRSKLFLFLFNSTHNVRNFVIYEVLMTILQLLFSAISILMSFLDKNQCPDILSLVSQNVLVKFIVFLAVPSFLPIIVYLFAIVYVIFSRLKHKYQQGSTGSFNKNVQLLLKFLALALIFFSSFILQNFFYFSTFLFDINIYVNVTVGDLGFILYALQPLLLIYAHSILKVTLLSYIHRFF